MESCRNRRSYESHGLDVVSIHECDAAANHSHEHLKAAQRVFVQELAGIEYNRLSHLFATWKNTMSDYMTFGILRIYPLIGLHFSGWVKDFLAQFPVAVDFCSALVSQAYERR